MPCWWAGARGARNEEQCCEKHASLEKAVSAQHSMILDMQTALQKLQAEMIAAHEVSKLGVAVSLESVKYRTC